MTHHLKEFCFRAKRRIVERLLRALGASRSEIRMIQKRKHLNN
jgi:hypothetical protein